MNREPPPAHDWIQFESVIKSYTWDLAKRIYRKLRKK